jgi:tRNA-2-methylthio-N6-dimethylallyladenosine synthase
MKYHLITYGCQMNTADSAEMAQPLQSRGFTATGDASQADIILMNTCTVRDQAEHRADSNLGRLREWKAANPERILIVAGCAASRWGESIKKKYPFIDMVSPATKIEEFPEAVKSVLRDRWDGLKETTLAEPAALDPEFRRESTNNWFGDENTAYVTIMRGCNYSCSYCIVPSVRGREKYRAMPDILAEITQRAGQGHREVMLLGQTVNSYYYRMRRGDAASDVVYDFSDLLRAVQAIPGVDAIRFMSPHPRHMKQKVIAAMAESPKVCRHLHLPVQSGSDAVLTRMKRLYTQSEYLDILKQLRAAMPEIKITTDVIVGYPGETDADFAETVALFQKAAFDGVFAFKYSPRPGTVSADSPDDVPNEIKESRLQSILALSRQKLDLKKSNSGSA